MSVLGRLAVILLVLGGCRSAPRGAGALERFEFTKLVMGVKARVVVYSPGEERARAAAAAAFTRMEELEQIMSDYRPDSELSRLPGRAVGEWAGVSRELWEVLALARAVSEASGGAFDVTCGGLSRLWREGRREGRLPDAEALKAALAASGWQKLEVHPNEPAVRLAVHGMRLDLGGIGKGYAAREAAKVLREFGARSHLVALAGDVVVGDPPPGVGGWRIEIDLASGSEGFIELRNAAVSTSGDSEQYVEADGVRYSHILDPRTGLGVTRRVACVVVAEDGAVADALGTAVCVLGAERGEELACRFKASALVREGNGTRRIGEFPRIGVATTARSTR
jgi:thiamine biosynthesis lipoprotein